MKFHDLIAVETLRNRGGPMSQAQRAAMFAKKLQPSVPANNITRKPAEPPPAPPAYANPGPPLAGGPWRPAGAPAIPVAPGARPQPPTLPMQPPSPDLGKPSVPRYIPPGQPGGRPWGESRPGEMYPAVEGPGNPSWERRHPERNPGAGGVPILRRPTPPAPVEPVVPPAPPPPVAVPITRRGESRIDYLGGGDPFRRAIQTRAR